MTKPPPAPAPAKKAVAKKVAKKAASSKPTNPMLTKTSEWADAEGWMSAKGIDPKEVMTVYAGQVGTVVEFMDGSVKLYAAVSASTVVDLSLQDVTDEVNNGTMKVVYVTPGPKGSPADKDAAIATFNLLRVSLENKGKMSDPTIEMYYDDLVTGGPAKTYAQAQSSLNKLMSAGAYGGNQRKRYRAALAKFWGEDLPGAKPVGPAAAAPKGSSTNGWAPIVPGGAPLVSKEVTSVAAANELVNPGYLTPSAAKGSIQKTIAGMMATHVTDQQLLDAALTDGVNQSAYITQMAQGLKRLKAGQPSKVKVTSGYGGYHGVTGVVAGQQGSGYDELRNALLMDLTNSFIQTWAASSNDSNPRSLAIQLAAIDEFGLKDTYPWSQAKNAAAVEYSKNGVFYRMFLRAMYDNTQQWAKANGVKKVKLRRGVKFKAGNKGDNVGAKLRPMSSFSSNAATANGFASGTVFEAVVPIEWIIGTAATGFGCQSEYEWVILGGIHQMRIV